MRIGINCGHTVSGTPGSGAVGFISESDETRAVGKVLMRILREHGHTVVDCTDDNSPSVCVNLKRICDLANAQKLDMFLSIHFNAGRGQGAEVYTAGGADSARSHDILAALCKLGFKCRGIKDGSHLYVIRNTNAQSALLEICFVDTEGDAALYKQIGAERVAVAIYEAITGEKTESEDLTVSQYEELKDMIDKLHSKVDELANPMIYNYIDTNMPDWARASVQKAMDKGIIKGDDSGLNLTYGDLRSIVREDRAGLYD